MTDSKYLYFVEEERTTKTAIWQVVSKRSNRVLGIIKWYGAWRQYAFFPFEETIWNPDCLMTVIQFIKECMEKWRTHKK